MSTKMKPGPASKPDPRRTGAAEAGAGGRRPKRRGESDAAVEAAMGLIKEAIRSGENVRLSVDDAVVRHVLWGAG